MRNTTLKFLKVAASLFFIFSTTVLLTSVTVAFYGVFFSRAARDESRPGINPQNFFSFHPLLGWTLKPDVKIRVSNSQGISSRLFLSVEKNGFRTSTPGRLSDSILLAGDSYVQGYHLYPDESIDSHLARKTGFSIVNRGVGGYSIVQEFLTIQNYIEQSSSSLKWVILAVCANDFPLTNRSEAWDSPVPFFPEKNSLVTISKPITAHLVEEEFKRNGVTDTVTELDQTWCCSYTKKEKFWRKLSESLNAFDTPWTLPTIWKEQIKPTIARREYGPMIDPVWYEAPEKRAYDFNLAFQFFLHTRQILDQKKVNFSVLFIPEPGEVVAKNQDKTFSMQRAFMERCKKFQIDCIEPSLEFVKEQKRRDLYWVDDGHFSPDGAEFIAQLLYEHGRKKHIFPQERSTR